MLTSTTGTEDSVTSVRRASSSAMMATMPASESRSLTRFSAPLEATSAKAFTSLVRRDEICPTRSCS
jgi:hypothetical protein